ncbi:hypothetical protein Syun_025452 [Stephania yunnanensis]|uniref:FAD dependent oxidoreductase domain-containing protein n=1 Tax=Stephania yunnanensis TaxID=152371 RepID=A0AAP0EUL8_9MAGN
MMAPTLLLHTGFYAVHRRNPNPNFNIRSSLSSQIIKPSSSSSLKLQPNSIRYAVLGAGFAGLSVVWHLLEVKTSLICVDNLVYNVVEQAPKDLHLCIDLYDEVGIGGGASGISGGLLHPYSPKAKLLWRGADCWRECLRLLNIAETTVASCKSDTPSLDFKRDANETIVWRRGIFRPATTLKNADVLSESAHNCLPSCKIELMDEDGAQSFAPHLCMPFNSAIFMPQAVNVHPQRYLQALFLSCKNLVKDLASIDRGEKELCLYQKSFNSLLELADDYDAAIICFGAKADLLPELCGKLPVRTCRGIVTHLNLPTDMGDDYADDSPSVLSDAWLAFQGPRDLIMGSTWDWRSRNYLTRVSEKETLTALEELLPKASVVFPSINKWKLAGAKAGVRAMPPLTPLGSVPLMGNVDYAISGNHKCKYWLLTGLGSRGLLYHGWLGKLMAQAVLSCDEGVLPHELTSWKNKTALPT